MKRLLSLALAWALILAAPLSFAQVSVDATKTGIAPAVYMLAASAADVSAAADTAENVLATITIPGGTVKAGSSIRVWPLWTHTNSANNKTLRVRLGGIGGTEYLTITATTTATTDRPILIRVITTGTQKGMAAAPVGFGSGAAIVTSSVNMAVDTTIVITGQKASAGETLTLNGYTVEVLP